MRLCDVDLELAREEGAGGDLGSVVEDDGGRFDVDGHGGGLLRFDLGALLILAANAVALESLHDERFLRLCSGVWWRIDRVRREEGGWRGLWLEIGDLWR